MTTETLALVFYVAIMVVAVVFGVWIDLLKSDIKELRKRIEWLEKKP